MKKRNRTGAVLLALLLCASLAAPALAADSGAPKITWLSTSVAPGFYNEELGWLTLYDTITYLYDGVIDLKTGTRVEYDEVYAFSDGLAMVVKHVANSPGSWKYGFVDQTGALVVPLEYDDAEDFSNGLASVAKRDADGNWKWG